MVWRNNSNGVRNVHMNNVNVLLSEKATHDLMGFPNVASQVYLTVF